MKNLFKKVVAVGIIFVLSLGTVSTVSAAVFYDSTTGMFVSTCESDGTLAFGARVYHDDGSIYGTRVGDGRYLENMVPTTYFRSISTLRADAALVGMDSDSQNTHQSRTYTYTPLDSYLVLGWSVPESSERNAETVNVEIANTLTGEIVARGFNLCPDSTFKVVIDLSSVPLEVSVSGRYVPSEILLGSTDTKTAEQPTFADIDFPGFSPLFTTPVLPRNIDGNQGIIVLSSISVDNLGGSNLHHAIGIRFDSGTNGMDTVNIGFSLSDCGSGAGYALNISRRQTARTIRLGRFTEVDVRMSTNSSTPGAATLTILTLAR